MALVAGSRIGGYEIVGLVGAGGMGEVYRARDPRLGREVAIKVLSAAAAADAGLLCRLEQEARTVAALNHPNLLAIFDLGEHDGAPFLVMELLEGETLRTRLGHGPLPIRRALAVARQVAQGLAAAHEQGVIHRDLKPENIFLLADGRAKILDFGLAKTVQAEAALAEAATLAGTFAATAATLPGTVLGTVGYMAPEQVRGEAATTRSDIFAFGAILYEMLSGRRAFGAASSVEVMSAILRDDPPEIVVAGAALPPALGRIVRRCLEKEPRQRFQTAADLEFALAALEETSSTTLRPPSELPAPAGAARSRIPLGLVGALVLAALIGAGVAVFILRGRSAPDITRIGFTLFAPDVQAGTSGHWSPDGSAVAFVASPTADQAPQIFVRYLASPSATQLTHLPDVNAVEAWSSDGHSILYKDTHDRLWSIAAVGGAPRQLYDFSTWNARSFAFSSQAWAVLRPVNGNYNIYLSPPGGQHWTPYAPAPFAATDIINEPQMAFSPDGRRLVLFINGGRGHEEAWLLPIPADPHHPPHLIRTDLNPELGTPTFSWMPDSRHILMAATRGAQPPQLFLFDAGNGTWRQLTASVNGDWHPSVSPDGTRALFVRTSGNYDVVTARLSDAVVSPLLADGASNNMPAWALHQPVMIYETTLGGIYQQLWVHTQDADGNSSERPLPVQFTGVLPIGPVLSPNADRVLYAAYTVGKGALGLMISSVTGGNPVPVLADASGFEVGPAWSPDGSQAVFLAIHGNQADLMLAPTSGQAMARRLHANVDTLIPVWSPDGAWIAYQNGTDDTIHLVSPDGKTDRNLGKLNTDAVAFSADSKLLYGIASSPGHNYLFQVDVATGAQHRIGDLGADFTPQTASQPTLRFTLTPDGKNLTFNTTRSNSSLWMMTNFH